MDGRGPAAERWKDALGASTGLVLASPGERPEALLVGPGTAEPFERAQEALSDGVAVLVATADLAPSEVQQLVALARHHACPLRFWESFRTSAGFRFLARLIGGQEPFWRPTHVRSLKLSPATGRRPCGALVDEELAMLDALLGRAPISVCAAVEGGPAPAGVVDVFMTVNYAGGLVAQATLSLAEAPPTRRLVVTTEGRCAALEESDRASRLRVIDRHRQDDEGESAAWEPSPRATAAADPWAGELHAFAAQIAQRRTADASADRRARVAPVALAVGRSMQSGGTVALTFQEGNETPCLRLIEGSGKKRAAPASWERPPLKLATIDSPAV
jgi:predicted dehydrogenase